VERVFPGLRSYERIYVVSDSLTTLEVLPMFLPGGEDRPSAVIRADPARTMEFDP
jgi:hypothetical protein